LSLPDQKNFAYSYRLAYELAREQLGRVDIGKQCASAGARYDSTTRPALINLDYLNQSYRITLPDVDIKPAESTAEVPISDKILILHYMTLAKGVPLSGRLISFKELPDAGSYFPTFAKRAIEPLVRAFAEEPGRLIATARMLGGIKADYGDGAVTITAFPRVPVTLVLWRGDEEFPPRGSILFDSSISGYLMTYDIIVLCETIAWKLVKSLREEV